MNDSLNNLMIQVNSFIDKILNWRETKQQNNLLVASLFDYVCENITENEMKQIIMIARESSKGDKISDKIIEKLNNSSYDDMKLNKKITTRDAVQSIIFTASSNDPEYLVCLVNFLFQQKNGKIKRLTDSDFDFVISKFLQRVQEDAHNWEEIILGMYKNTFNLLKSVSINTTDYKSNPAENKSFDDEKINNFDEMKKLM
jgi:hypothetical protein